MNRPEFTTAHEQFDVFKKNGGKRKQAYRPQRHSAEDSGCYLSIGEDRYPVLNYSAFGVAIRVPAALSEQETLTDIPFLVEHIEIDVLSLRRVRCEQYGETSIIAYEITSGVLNLDRLKGAFEALYVMRSHLQEASAYATLPESIKAKVFVIREQLQSLKDSLGGLESRLSYSNSKQKNEMEETICSELGAYLSPVFTSAFGELASDLAALEENQKQSAITFLQNHLSHLAYDAPFANRAFFKPLGYAGDYEMMNLIYAQEEIGRSLYARTLQSYFITEPSAQAVRNRASYLLGKIQSTIKEAKGSEINFASIACGPAHEWNLYLQDPITTPLPITLNLIDQDEAALSYAHSTLRGMLNANDIKGIQIQYSNTAIKNIIARGLDQQRYDLIYSAGLFDYLSEPVAFRAAERLYEALKPGGQLIIGNFNTKNPNSMVMEYALDWHLIYRSIDELYRLFSPIGPTAIENEPLEINLFTVLTKPR